MRNTYLSKKGLVNLLMSNMRELPTEKKPAFGQMVNDLKNEIEVAFVLKQDGLQLAEMNQKLENEKIDLSLPATPVTIAIFIIYYPFL